MTSQLKEMIETGRISVVQVAESIRREKKPSKDIKISDSEKKKFWTIFKKKTNKKIDSSLFPESQREKMINDVMDNFDFERCHLAMKALDWCWVGVGVPTVEMLQDSALDRIFSAIKGLSSSNGKLPKNSQYFSQSGGLKATAWRNKRGVVESIRLEFILSESNSDLV